MVFFLHIWNQQVNGVKVPLEFVLLCRVSLCSGVVRLLDACDTDKMFVIVMEQVEYCQVFDFITERGALPENMARNFFRQVVEAALQCHQAGVFHLDIKVCCYWHIKWHFLLFTKFPFSVIILGWKYSGRLECANPKTDRLWLRCLCEGHFLLRFWRCIVLT